MFLHSDYILIQSRNKVPFKIFFRHLLQTLSFSNLIHKVIKRGLTPLHLASMKRYLKCYKLISETKQLAQGKNPPVCCRIDR